MVTFETCHNYCRQWMCPHLPWIRVYPTKKGRTLPTIGCKRQHAAIVCRRRDEGCDSLVHTIDQPDTTSSNRWWQEEYTVLSVDHCGFRRSVWRRDEWWMLRGIKRIGFTDIIHDGPLHRWKFRMNQLLATDGCPRLLVDVRGNPRDRRIILLYSLRSFTYFSIPKDRVKVAIPSVGLNGYLGYIYNKNDISIVLNSNKSISYLFKWHSNIKFHAVERTYKTEQKLCTDFASTQFDQHVGVGDCHSACSRITQHRSIKNFKMNTSCYGLHYINTNINEKSKKLTPLCFNQKATTHNRQYVIFKRSNYDHRLLIGRRQAGRLSLLSSSQ